METAKQHRKQYDWLKAYQFKKGETGNPNGRPKGKSLKTFAREFLEDLPDDDKVEFLAVLPPEIVWKMAEGMPAQDTNLRAPDGLVIKFDQAFAPPESETPSQASGDSV